MGSTTVTRYLITGAEGHLGRSLKVLLGDAAFACPKGVLDVRGDLALVRAYRPDVVFNCAAFNDVNKAEVTPLEAFALNAVAAGHLARECHKVGAKFVTFSTDYVFGGPGDPFRDDPAHVYSPSHVPSPCNTYGASKLAGESLARLHDPGAVVVRTSCLYGHSTTGKPSMVSVLLARGREGKTSEVVDDNKCSPTHAGHLASAVVEHYASLPGGVYHATSAGFCSWYQYALRAYAAAGLSPKLLVPVSTKTWQRNAAAQMAAPRPRYGRLVGFRVTTGPGILPGWEAALDAHMAAVKEGTI